jgi:hypothetical protein
VQLGTFMGLAYMPSNGILVRSSWRAELADEVGGAIGTTAERLLLARAEVPAEVLPPSRMRASHEQSMRL